MRILTFLLFLSVFGFSQNPNNKFISPLNLEHLETIDTLFSNKILIGIGECTHGTSEFTISRQQIFEYLVKKHQFNTIFIEAESSACLKLNRYLQGANENLNQAILDLSYFAWTTEEMRNFMQWVRNYNQNNHTHIQLIGIDIANTDTTTKYRDSCMASNILQFIEQNPNTKGIFIAHNGHISNKSVRTSNVKTFKSTGYILKQKLNDNYLILAQTTNQATFNVFTYVNNQPVFSAVTLKKAKRKTIEHLAANYHYPIALINFKAISKVSHYEMTMIGHTFGKTPMKYTIKRTNYLIDEMYDFVIYFENTQETKIIN